MNPTQEKKIPTSVGMETATETVNRVNQARTPAPVQAPITANTVPMSNLATTPQSVDMPTPTPLVFDVSETVASANQTLAEQDKIRATTEVDRAGSVVSQSERQVRELMGVMGTQTETRNQLEGRAGVEGFSEDLQKFQQNLRRQVADLDQFDINNTNTIEQMRVDASKRDITKRTFNAMSAEAGIQMAVQRANKVASTRATIAAIDVTQGNLQAATEQVDKAMKAIYEPIKMGLEMEMFFLQRNDKRFDSAQQGLARAREREIVNEQNYFERVQRNVDEALATGATTSSEVFMLASPDTTNEERLALAQLVKSRGAMEMRNLEMQSARLDMSVKAEQLAKLRQPVIATRDTSVIDVNGDKQLIDTQTGEIIANFGANVSVNEVQNARDVNFINTIDILKDHPGMSKAVGTTGLARFTPFKADVMTGQVSDFVGSVENIVKQLTLNTFAEAKARGITFGASSEAEWKILGDSASKINNFRRERDDGSIYYDTSEKVMKTELDLLSNFGKMDAIRKGVDPASIGVIQQPDGKYFTRNSDGTIVELSVTVPQ